MIRLKRFSPYTILLWWAKTPSHNKEDLQHIIRQGRLHQIDHQDLTLPKVRRHVKRLLYSMELLPKHRKPTDRDYQAAKKRFLDLWYDQDII